MSNKQERTFDVEVHYVAHIPERILNKVIKEAEESGFGYEDPGKQEIVRRLLISAGINAIEELDLGTIVKYTRNK